MSSIRHRNTGNGTSNSSPTTNKVGTLTKSIPIKTTKRSSLFGLLFMIFFAFPVAYFSDELLPAPEPATIHPSLFSEERALKHLLSITDFGVRTVGSEANEQLTPEYILNFVNTVKKNAPDGVDIEAEIQKPSGSFTSWFLGGFTNIYDSVTNVLVRVSFSGARTKQNALLVSAHFDTAIGTVAASDDAANIAAMLECFSNIVHGPELAHSIIFIFNGAEETNWQAAHGFITQHKWSKTIRSVVNLEGTGAGGRAMVVQTGPRHAWLVEAFKKVAPRPHASTMAQEIFQTKIIPGWTDFETYVEFSTQEIAGIDMVFIRNGYVYHTSSDDFKHVTKGTMQHLGNNLLPTLRELADSPYLVDAVHYKDKTAVFWDLAGMVLVVFPDVIFARIWYCILLVAVLLQLVFDENREQNVSTSGTGFVWKHIKLLLSQIVIFLSGIVFSLFVGSTFMILGCSMSWFSSLYTTWFLYAVSSLTGTLIARTFFVQMTENNASTASCLLWSLLLFIGVYFNVQSSYVPAVPLFFQCIGSILSKYIISGRRRFQQMSVVCNIITHFIPCLLLAQYYCTLGTFFVPITGRIGDWIPSDLLVAVILGVVGSLLWTIPTSTLHSSSKVSSTLLKTSCVINLVVLIYVLNQTPYTKERPKRLYVQQVSRTTYKPQLNVGDKLVIKDHDQGLWVNAFDKRGLSSDEKTFNNIPELTNGRKHVTCEHDKVYCGFPWYFPVQEMLRNQWYVPLKDHVVFPTINEQFQLNLIKKVSLDNGGNRYEFIATGPSHMTAVIEGKLKRWSFTKDNVPYKNSQSCTDAMVHRKDNDSKMEDCRFVFYSTGKLGTNQWKFWIETPNSNKGMKIAFYGHYGLDVMAEGNTLNSVRKQIPKWVTMVSWVSHWHQYEFV